MTSPVSGCITRHRSAGRLRDEAVRRDVGIPSEADHDVVVDARWRRVIDDDELGADVVQEPTEQPYGFVTAPSAIPRAT